jgi:uncharacterized delta-60 repeat protein
LDPDFASGGIKVFDTGRQEYINDVAMAGDRIFLAGWGWTSGADRLLLVKLKKGGAFDATFGTGGIKTDSFGSASARAQALVVQPDGKILTSGVGGGPLEVARYRPGGKRDDSFGSNGHVRTSFNANPSLDVADMALHTKGSILVAGSADTEDTDFGLLRLKPNGKRDRTFAGDGRAQIDFAGEDDEGKAIALQGGKVLMTGIASVPLDSDKDGTGVVRVKGPSASVTTLNVNKSGDKVFTKGAVDPNHHGQKVVVTLFKKQAGTFKKVTSRKVTLTSQSRYTTSFARVSANDCKMRTLFDGDLDHKPSSASVTFGC